MPRGRLLRLPHPRSRLGADGQRPLFNPLQVYQTSAALVNQFVGPYQQTGPNLIRQSVLPTHIVLRGLVASNNLDQGDVVALTSTSDGAKIAPASTSNYNGLIGVAAHDALVDEHVEVITYGPVVVTAGGTITIARLLTVGSTAGRVVAGSNSTSKGRILGKALSGGSSGDEIAAFVTLG